MPLVDHRERGIDQDMTSLDSKVAPTDKQNNEERYLREEKRKPGLSCLGRE